jgi:putative toxin-antitoxin system antitoxin component (TIGR02293 family)
MSHMKRKKAEYKTEPFKGNQANSPDENAGRGSVLGEQEAAYMVSKVRDGLPFDEFHALQEMLGVTEEKMGALLGMSRATLHRRKKTGNLDRTESDRLVRYARILNCVTAFFQSHEAAAKWLKSPAFAFNGETPLDYADTEIGAREVEALVWRIENGVSN